MKVAIGFTLGMVAMAMAANAPETVSSKKGNIDLLRQPGGEVLCTASFGEEMSVRGRQGAGVLVEAQCGRGWVQVNQVQGVAAPAKDKSIILSGVDVWGHNDLTYLTNVFNDQMISPPEVQIQRDFRDFLTHTIDRESQERHHGEN